MKKFKNILILLILFSFIFAGCAKKDPIEQTQFQSINLTVSAAASLMDCLEEIKDLYIDRNPNIEITYNFGSSGSLQQQIEQGAPADIFLSAGKSQMDTLIHKNLMINDSIKDILENKLVLITPADTRKIHTFEELIHHEIKKIAIGEPGSVPAGQYSEEALKNLNLFDQLQPKFVFAKDVREVLSWVETENVDAGLVYQTDAKISDKVQISTVAPQGSHQPIIYPAGIVKASKNKEEAQKFIDFLFEEEVKELFIKYGFSPLTK